MTYSVLALYTFLYDKWPKRVSEKVYYNTIYVSLLWTRLGEMVKCVKCTF